MFSPDTRFVAFTSGETGRAEVYVTTFPERRQTWPLTTDGGRVPSWGADGKEILVATLAGQIVAYSVSTTGGSFSAGAGEILIPQCRLRRAFRPGHAGSFAHPHPRSQGR